MFNLVLVAGTWGLVELFSLVAVFFTNGSIVLAWQLRHSMAQRDPVQLPGNYSQPVMIHPYIGAVLQPHADGGRLSIDGKYRITEYGFVDNGPPIHKRSADRVIVAIVGGSVARQMAMNATDLLERELAEIPQFAGRSFQFVRLAVDGYKKPQQQVTINYLLTLGAEFDVVINLDGVNESALPKMDNVPYHVFAAYPRKWGTMIASAGSIEINRLIGYVAYLRHRQRDRARFFENLPLRYSPTATLIWNVFNDRSDKMVRDQLETISLRSINELSYSSSGPPESFDSDQELYEHCVGIWCRSSILLHQLCAANGIRYFHFLQPNQYLKGSKPIESDEAVIALSDNSPFRIPIEVCFPLMQSRAAELSGAGVTFTDLTGVFSDRREQIYKDDCCHVVKAGDEIMARAIAARIKQAYLLDAK
jgi:hypothetical protein